MVAFPLARTYHPSRHRPLTTEDRVTIADAKAAHERGRPVVLIRPPAVERAAELWELIIPATPGHGPGASPPVVIICADDASAAEWAAAAPAGLSAHAVTGLARTSRILKERSVDMLAGAVRDLSALVQRAALKLDHVSTVVVAWPEGLTGHEAAAALDTLLARSSSARPPWMPRARRWRPSAGRATPPLPPAAVPSPFGTRSTPSTRRTRSSGTASRSPRLLAPALHPTQSFASVSPRATSWRRWRASGRRSCS